MVEKIRFVDANIFLEVFLQDARWEEARDFLEKLSKGDLEGITTDYIIFSILLQIENKKKSTKEMKDFVAFLGNMKGLKIAHFTLGILMKAMSVMENYGLDFDDALEAAYMLALDISEIVSFDRDFDRVKGIKRVEPREII